MDNVLDYLADRIGDNCPRCLQGPVRPYSFNVQRLANTVDGQYLCDCGHAWRCSWSLSALDLDGVASPYTQVAV
jgi:hypothetical protein